MSHYPSIEQYKLKERRQVPRCRIQRQQRGHVDSEPLSLICRDAVTLMQITSTSDYYSIVSVCISLFERGFTDLKVS